MSWERVIEGRVAAYVWPLMPLKVDALVPGRWPQPDPMWHAIPAVLEKEGFLLDLHRNGQEHAITARFEVRPDDKALSLWPNLSLDLEPGKRFLKSRSLLIYEGNHRWAAAAMLGWEWVLVEPQVWFYEGVTVDPAPLFWELHEMAHLHVQIPNPSKSRPRRDDLRPIESEVRNRCNFSGRDPWLWIDRIDR